MEIGAESGGTVVIVGAGQAGFQVAASLRDEGYSGRIRLLGDEPGLPYQRPPLSKAYLVGKADRTGLQLRPETFFAQRGIEMTSDHRAERIDREPRHLHLAGGEVLGYDHLVIATGARNRLLPVPGTGLEGVLQLRTHADADALRGKMTGLKRAVVVGAGFIGLEFAAAAAAAGAEVTVIEATARPMSRALTRPMSQFFRQAHEKAGVRLVFDADVTEVHGKGGHVTEVETADGRIFPADLVLVGIGVIPNAELAADCGLAVENGIVVDETLCTADPAISAVGDCAAYPLASGGGARVRLESVQNAIDHGRCVASRLMGRPRPYHIVPWFWSDQGPYKLQIAGFSMPSDRVALRGDPTSGAFSTFCFAADRLVGVESVNKPADHMVARRLLANATALSFEQASDTSFDLKALTIAS